MLIPVLHDTPSGAGPWAEVRAHDHVVRYRRLGAGRTILVLAAEERSGSGWSGMAQELAAGFRVIVPEPPSSHAAPAEWLAGFLEGLGVSRLAIVATEGFHRSALEVAMLAPDQIDAVMLLPEGDGEVDAHLRGTLEIGRGRARIPLTLARRRPGSGEILAAVREALGEDAASIP